MALPPARRGQGCKTYHIVSLRSVPYGTCFMGASRTRCPTYSFIEEKRALSLKSFSVAASSSRLVRVSWLTAGEVYQKRKESKKTEQEILPWTFWCSMRWQSHMDMRKMRGWRWCFSILNMMERQSEPRIWHGQRKSNLLKVAVLNKCQSENAASLLNL